MFKYITRKGRLRKNIESELLKPNPDINIILDYVDKYEMSNLTEIKRLKRGKIITINKINGALKQTINAHGPIKKEFIGSASKRIYGSFLEVEKENLLKRINKLLWKFLSRLKK